MRRNPDCVKCRRIIDTQGDDVLVSWKGRVYHQDCFLEYLEDRVDRLVDRYAAYGLRPRAQAELKNLLHVRKIYEDKGILQPLPGEVTIPP
uniref:Uncharacterized protein n=1 Tax=viral metagenome TaxID=1070528 RepID=A0A6H2A4N6_9ZZZZ